MPESARLTFATQLPCTVVAQSSTGSLDRDRPDPPTSERSCADPRWKPLLAKSISSPFFKHNFRGSIFICFNPRNFRSGSNFHSASFEPRWRGRVSPPIPPLTKCRSCDCVAIRRCLPSTIPCSCLQTTARQTRRRSLAQRPPHAAIPFQTIPPPDQPRPLVPSATADKRPAYQDRETTFRAYLDSRVRPAAGFSIVGGVIESNGARTRPMRAKLLTNSR